MHFGHNIESQRAEQMRHGDFKQGTRPFWATTEAMLLLGHAAHAQLGHVAMRLFGDVAPGKTLVIKSTDITEEDISRAHSAIPFGSLK